MEGVCSHLRATLHVCAGMCPLGTSGRGMFPPTCHISCAWWDVSSRDQWKGYVPTYVSHFMCGGMCPLGTSGRGMFPPMCHTSSVWWDVSSRDQWKGYVPTYMSHFMFVLGCVF